MITLQFPLQIAKVNEGMLQSLKYNLISVTNVYKTKEINFERASCLRASFIINKLQYGC